jgi:adenine deaminase
MLDLKKTAVSREDLVSVALGNQCADLAILNGQLVDVYSGEIHPADIAIKGDRTLRNL